MTVHERLAALRAGAAEAVRFHPREVVGLALVAILLVAGAGLAYARSRPVPADSVAPIHPASPADDTVALGGPILVHVVGAVRRPGVYELRDGARVIDAVRAAGGLRRSADGAALNLARALADGEQIVVPRRGAAAARAPGSSPAGGARAPDGTININLAGVSELDTLPGIGPVLAERIVAYRDQHGPFRSVRDLLKVSGIGPKTFEQLEEAITV